MNESKEIKKLLPLTFGKRSWLRSILHTEEWLQLFILGFFMGCVIGLLYGFHALSNGQIAGLCVVFVVLTGSIMTYCHKNAYFVQVNEDRIKVHYGFLGFKTSQIALFEDIQTVSVRVTPDIFLFRSISFLSIEYIEITVQEEGQSERHIIRFPSKLAITYMEGKYLFLLGHIIKTLSPEADVSEYEQSIFEQEVPDAYYQGLIAFHNSGNN